MTLTLLQGKTVLFAWRMVLRLLDAEFFLVERLLVEVVVVVVVTLPAGIRLFRQLIDKRIGAELQLRPPV